MSGYDGPSTAKAEEDNADTMMRTLEEIVVALKSQQDTTYEELLELKSSIGYDVQAHTGRLSQLEAKIAQIEKGISNMGSNSMKAQAEIISAALSPEQSKMALARAAPELFNSDELTRVENDYKSYVEEVRTNIKGNETSTLSLPMKGLSTSSRIPAMPRDIDQGFASNWGRSDKKFAANMQQSFAKQKAHKQSIVMLRHSMRADLQDQLKARQEIQRITAQYDAEFSNIQAEINSVPPDSHGPDREKQVRAQMRLMHSKRSRLLELQPYADYVPEFTSAGIERDLAEINANITNFQPAIDNIEKTCKTAIKVHTKSSKQARKKAAAKVIAAEQQKIAELEANKNAIALAERKEIAKQLLTKKQKIAIRRRQDPSANVYRQQIANAAEVYTEESVVEPVVVEPAVVEPAVVVEPVVEPAVELPGPAIELPTTTKPAVELLIPVATDLPTSALEEPAVELQAPTVEQPALEQHAVELPQPSAVDVPEVPSSLDVVVDTAVDTAADTDEEAVSSTKKGRGAVMMADIDI